MACIHHRVEPGKRLDEDYGWQPIDMDVCEWPDQNPARFVAAPLWMTGLIGTFFPINPDRHCQNCPAFHAAEAS